MSFYTKPLDEDAGGDRLAVEPLFSSLSNLRRIYVIGFLREDGHLSASEVATRIANSKADGEASRSERKSVYSSLIQLHLPKLDQQGVIRYDERSKEITKGRHFAQTASVLSSAISSVEVDRESLAE